MAARGLGRAARLAWDADVVFPEGWRSGDALASGSGDPGFSPHCRLRWPSLSCGPLALLDMGGAVEQRKTHRHHGDCQQ